MLLLWLQVGRTMFLASGGLRFSCGLTIPHVVYSSNPLARSQLGRLAIATGRTQPANAWPHKGRGLNATKAARAACEAFALAIPL